MLDVVYGICRICGNRPGSSCKPADYRTVMPDAILRAGQLDPFSVLPENNLPRMHELMKHCMPSSLNMSFSQFASCQSFDV
jgi:hypothetical protein